MHFSFLRSTLAVTLLFSLSPSARASEEGEELRAADAKLNTTYQQALKAMPDAETKAKLREAEQAWIAFRDKEIELNGALPGASGNMLKMLQTELTEARTAQLAALIEAVGEGGTE